MQTFGQKVYDFYNTLTLPTNLPPDVTAFSPLEPQDAKEHARKFYDSFFNDTNKRVLVLGINPGRFGSGVTGINFTDPVALQEDLNIKNDLPKRRELSSEFVYKFINQWGGAKNFYAQFFLTALSPVGFLYKGLNYNFYDNKTLMQDVEPFIIDSLQKQIAFGTYDTAILFGTGKNQAFFTKLNSNHGFFKNFYVLEHPRYIMQYKRRYLEEYLKKYCEVFSKSLISN